jgi:GNAT superfamily N-acetyltransferase
MKPTILTVSGSAFEQWLEPVAALRIQVFREFPYLYDGSLDYEKHYLQRYIDSPNSTLVLALDGDKVVGASTALPMRDADDAFQLPFRRHGFDINDIYYFGESVLQSQYRGSGIGHRFFDAREQAAREQGCSITTFCAVQRPSNHPARPQDYVPHHAFWDRRGYTPRPDLTCDYHWRDIGDSEETLKPMLFWIKTC